MESDLLADGVGVVAAIGEQCFGLVRDHVEELAEALHIVCLAGRHDEAERPAFPVAAGMEFGGEATARSAKRLGRLSPLFMPTAQWCARTMVLSIIR